MIHSSNLKPEDSFVIRYNLKKTFAIVIEIC
jgi:hypothetical protein